MGTLDFGRDQTDIIIRDVGTDWWDDSRGMIPALLDRAINTVAEANNVDPGYIRWILFHYPKAWIRLSGASMLDAARRLFLESNAKTPSSTNRSLPPDMAGERRVQKALVDLVKWANGPLKSELAKGLVSLAGPASSQIQRAVVADGGEPLSAKQAKMVVIVELPLRIRDHPHWFRDPGTLGLMVKGVLG